MSTSSRYYSQSSSKLGFVSSCTNEVLNNLSRSSFKQVHISNLSYPNVLYNLLEKIPPLTDTPITPYIATASLPPNLLPFNNTTNRVAYRDILHAACSPAMPSPYP
jgi:hypothetical protein